MWKKWKILGTVSFFGTKFWVGKRKRSYVGQPKNLKLVGNLKLIKGIHRVIWISQFDKITNSNVISQLEDMDP